MQKWIKRILAVLLVLLASVLIYQTTNRQNQQSACAQIFAMDTYMELTAYGKNCESAVRAAQSEIERLDALLSTGNKDSEVSRLNRNKSGKVSDDTAYLIQRSLEIYDYTNGAFDITIYPVMQAWGFTGKTYRIPDSKELKELLLSVDSSRLKFDSEKNTLTMPQEVEIDFGGIAKGYTSSRVVQIMKDYGIESAVLNLGGNVQLVGGKTDGDTWKIAIKSPNEQEKYLGVIEAKDKAIITSGGYERYFEQNGIKYHHIIDPATGMPAYNGLQSVTIVCNDGTLADGLSTALYVMGTEKTITFWRKHTDQFDAILYTDDGKLYVTQGIASDFTSEHEVEIIR